MKRLATWTAAASACFALALGFATAALAEPATYTLVFLKTGPRSGQLPEAENKAAFAGHFANMGRLAEERKLLVAGPFGKEKHDPALRGLFVLKTADLEEAKTWASTDPAVIAGVFVLEFHQLRTEKDLLAALERHYAQEAQAKADGRELKLEETMRFYVWLKADDRARARAALEPLAAQGKIFLLADLADHQLLALLDAENAAAARATYGPTLDNLGPHSLDDWYGSKQLTPN